MKNTIDATAPTAPKKGLKGFTLAEVLITLAIIGIVAVLTVPALMQNYKKRVVVTRLQKTYSLLNQAVTMSIVDNGEVSNWSAKSETGEDIKVWFQKYFGKYLKYNELKVADSAVDSNGEILYVGLRVYLPDGSMVFITNSNNSENGVARDWHYYIDSTKADVATLDTDNKYEVSSRKGVAGRDIFSFYFDTEKNRFLPYGYHQLDDIDKDEIEYKDIRDVFMNRPVYGCSQSGAYMCSALIMYDGWQIKDDYPVKF